MEPAGLAIGVLGLAGIFSTCLDIVEKWDSYKEFGVESKALMARFVSDRALFVEWGERTGLAKGRLENKYHRTFDRPPTREAVGKVLKSIEDIELGISNSTFTPPQIYVPNGPLAQGKSVLREDTQLNNHPGMASRMVKLKWALRNKARFIALIDSFNKLVQNLYNLVPLDQSTSAEQKVSEIEGNDSASLHATIQSILADMKKQRDDEVRSELHNWLDTYDTDRRYHDFIRRRLEGTCEWIFNRSEFLQWQSFTSENTEVLWIHAPPGYGKTILCARVIEKLLERPERPLAYSFFSSELQSRADPFVVMRSWISGIISQNREAFDLACRRWEEADRRPPSQTDIEELFNSIVRKIPGCTFIVDGLDECSVRENDKAEDRYSLLDFLKSLEHSMSAAKSRLLIISRKDQEIREGLSGSRSSLDWKVTEMQIVPEDVGLDVKLFSRSIVKKRLANKTELQRHELAQRMVDRCDSTFLAIKLLEPDLKGGKNLKQLQKIIDEAPDKLDRIYDRNWARITNLGDVERQRAFSILRWATFALRPITVSEITEVLLLADDEVEALDYTELPDSVDQVYIKTEILDLCESLVEVQGEKSDSNLGRLTIHLSHFSVRQFVLTHLPVHPEELIANAQLQSSNMAMHNNILAKTCIRYLDCESTWSVTQKSDGNSGVIQVFRDYASISWHKHVNIETDRSEDLVKLINAFFHPKNQNWQSWGKHSEHSFLDGMMSYDGDLDYANPLFYASLLGFTKTLDYLIEECGLDVNSADAANRTALLGACSRGWTAGVRHLLSKGAVVNTSSNKGVTPLHVSAMRGHVDGVKLLLEKGACLHVKDKINATPLNRAAFAGHTEVVKLLLEKGADLESQNKAGYTPLNDAASRGHVEVVKLLLGKGADLESQTNEGLRPLSYAACNGNVEVVKLLLEKGADLKLRTKAGFTPLTYAATMGHVGVVKLLLEKGADLESKHIEGWTPLILAAFEGHVEVVKLLIEKGADLESQHMEGWTPLIFAASTGHVEVVKLLIEKGANMESQHMKGWTPLISAATRGHVEVVKLLLEKGADLELQDKDGSTSLSLAAYQGHVEVVKLLLEKRTALELQGKARWASLSSAASNGQVEVIKLLFEKGADLEFQTNNGFTPLSYAASNGHVEVVKLLLEKKANLNVAPANRSRFAPLHLAVSGGHTEVLQLLLESGADPNAADKYGLSPLILAAIKGKESIVQLLLAQHNVDPQSSDLRGRTALSWASIKGHEAVIELLLADERVIRDSRGHVDYTPLMRAVRKSEYSVVRGFIQRGYPADERDRDSLLLQVAILMPLEAFEEIAVAMGFDSEDFTLGLEGLFHEEE